MPATHSKMNANPAHEDGGDGGSNKKRKRPAHEDGGDGGSNKKRKRPAHEDGEESKLPGLLKCSLCLGDTFLIVPVCTNGHWMCPGCAMGYYAQYRLMCDFGRDGLPYLNVSDNTRFQRPTCPQCRTLFPPLRELGVLEPCLEMYTQAREAAGQDVPTAPCVNHEFGCSFVAKQGKPWADHVLLCEKVQVKCPRCDDYILLADARDSSPTAHILTCPELTCRICRVRDGMDATRRFCFMDLVAHMHKHVNVDQLRKLLPDMDNLSDEDMKFCELLLVHAQLIRDAMAHQHNQQQASSSSSSSSAAPAPAPAPAPASASSSSSSAVVASSSSSALIIPPVAPAVPLRPLVTSAPPPPPPPPRPLRRTRAFGPRVGRNLQSAFDAADAELPQGPSSPSPSTPPPRARKRRRLGAPPPPFSASPDLADDETEEDEEN